MSFDIFYDRQFIKVDANRVVPFYLVGSSNLYEMDNKKRVRNWSNLYNHNDSLIIDNAKLLANIDQYRLERAVDCVRKVNETNDVSWGYSDKHWGYYIGLALYPKSTYTTTFGMYKSFYENGIKEAMTIEELRHNGVTITMSISAYVDINELATLGLEKLPSVTFTSTEHMIQSIAEYEAYYSGVKAKLWLSSYGMQSYRDTYRRNKRIMRQTNKKVKEPTLVSEYWVLKSVDSDTYFVRNLRNCYQYGYTILSAKTFATEKAITRFHTRMANKDKFKVEHIVGKKYMML